MNILIIEGIATSGKSSLIHELKKLLVSEKLLVFDESKTHEPIMQDTADTHVDYFIRLIQEAEDSGCDYVIFDRLHFTQAIRSKSSIENYRQLEQKLLAHRTLVSHLHVDESSIEDRVKLASEHRDKEWKNYIFTKGSTFSEIAQYYISQQQSVDTLLDCSILYSKQYDTTKHDYEHIAKSILNDSQTKPIFSSEIVPNTTWELFVDDGFMPANDMVTAVSVVVVSNLSKKEVVITRNDRGWEVIAGHVEKDEEPEETAHREALEEGGVKIKNLKLIGYTKVTNHSQKPFKPHYPHPISYVLNYVAFVGGEIGKPTGEEIIESKVADPIEVEVLVQDGLMSKENQILIGNAFSNIAAKNSSYSLPHLDKMVDVVIDRPLGSKHPKHDFVYELNYGYIPNTKAPDGKELDAYVTGVDKPIKKFRGKCIAIIHRKDDDDDKLIVVPESINLTDEEILKATHFQEQWFDVEVIRPS